MYIWLVLICTSALIGFLAARYLKINSAIYFAGAIPWFALLAAIVYTEYFMPYGGGGASMWPIAQLFGGTVAAVIGVYTFKLTRKKSADE
jgi:NADH:ubiquinone oxidoreductase subunit 6 (subunit J)